MDIETQPFEECFMAGDTKYGNLTVKTKHRIFRLWCMPGQCSTAIITSHGLSTQEEDQKYNDSILDIAISLAKRLDFSALIITDNNSIDYLIEKGFNLYSIHTSTRSDNKIYQYIKHL